MARIWVRDHGIGIAPEDQARIFSRFERSHTGASFEGYGLGLHIVNKLVHALNGEVQVASIPGEGSTFSVFIPRRVATTPVLCIKDDAHPPHRH